MEQDQRYSTQEATESHTGHMEEQFQEHQLRGGGGGKEKDMQELSPPQLREALRGQGGHLGRALCPRSPVQTGSPGPVVWRGAQWAPGKESPAAGLRKISQRSGGAGSRRRCKPAGWGPGAHRGLCASVHRALGPSVCSVQLFLFAAFWFTSWVDGYTLNCLWQVALSLVVRALWK